MTVDLVPLGRIGKALQRPECVLVKPAGDLVVSDSRGGVTVIGADGGCRHVSAPGGTTNGIAQDRDGTLYLAGIDSGTVHTLSPDGTGRLEFRQIDGHDLGAANFVHFDPMGDLWLTVSTRTVPRSRAIDQPIPDGYLAKRTASGLQRMASGLCFANEMRFDPAMHHVYLAESRRGRVVRMRILDSGDLGPVESFGPDPLFEGAIVDGLSFDVDGGLWVTEVTRNGIHRIDPDGRVQSLFEDPAAEVLNFPASIAFGGDDGKTVFVGSIRLDHLVTMRSSVAGAPMWHQR